MSPRTAAQPPEGWEPAGDDPLTPDHGDERRLRALAEEAMRNRHDPRIHAPHTRWKCMSEDGVSGHPDYEQRVAWGEMPKCPVCGSPRGMPVDAAEQVGI